MFAAIAIEDFPLCHRGFYRLHHRCRGIVWVDDLCRRELPVFSKRIYAGINNSVFVKLALCLFGFKTADQLGPSLHFYLSASLAWG